MRNDVYLEGSEEEQSLDLHRVLEFLRRRRVSIILAISLALPPALIMPFMEPDIYEATAKVTLEATPEVMEIGPDVMPTEGGRGFMAAMTALVLSDTILGRVADQMPPPGKRVPGTLEQWSVDMGFSEAHPEPTPQQARLARVARVRRALTLKPDGGGTLLLITAKGLDPAGATFLANAVADAFVRYRQEQRDAASRRAIAWLNQKTYELREQTARREEAIAELMLRTGVGPSDLEAAEVNEIEGQLTAELRAAKIELLVTQQRMAELAPKIPKSSRGSSNERATLLREQYDGARAELEIARLRYTNDHPEVVRLEGVVASLEKRLGTDTGRHSDDYLAEDMREYHTLDAQRARLEARVDVLNQAIDQAALEDTPSSEAISEYERLERELTIDRQMLEVLLRRRNETLLTAAVDHPGAEVLDYAVRPLGPVGPVRQKLLVMGIGLAFCFGFGVGLLRELLDRRVRDPEEVARMLGAPSLGLIPRVHDGSAPERQSAHAQGSLAGESYRNLRTGLMFLSGQRDLSSLVVTSAIAGEGKTSVSSNLAASISRTGRSVLLVDADLRRPRVDKVFALKQNPGLADVLSGRASLEGSIRCPVGCDFHVLTSGQLPPNPSELLGSSKFNEVLAEMKQKYDVVILDSPVLLAVSDSLLLAARADATLLVHKPGSVDSRALERMRADLNRASAQVIGVVFNQVDVGDRYLYPSYLESPYLHKPRRAPRIRRPSSGAKAG